MRVFIGAKLLSSRAAQPTNKPFEIYDSRLAGFTLRVQPTGVRSYYARLGRSRRIALGKVGTLLPDEARERMLPEGEFLEIYIDTPLSVAEGRDVKGLYKKARAGQLKNFTGIDSPYEAPVNSEVRIDTTQMTLEQAADLIVEVLLK